MKEKVRYIYNAKYKSELGICNFEVFRDYDHKLSEVEKKEELYKFNSLLKEKHNAEVVIISHLYKQGEEKSLLNDIVQIDLNKLKSYNLESTLVEQLISVIDEINEGIRELPELKNNVFSPSAVSQFKRSNSNEGSGSGYENTTKRKPKRLGYDN